MSRARSLTLIALVSLPGLAAAEPPPVPPTKTVLFVGAATVACLAAGTAAGFAGAALPLARFGADGRPDPLAIAGGLAIGFAVDFTLLHLALPELARLANTQAFVGSPAAARAEAWRVGRWPALAAVLSLATVTGGAIAERSGFANGQWPMLIGVGAFVISALTWNVLEAVFSWVGFTASRAPAR
ncbi:MAG: hypothetical protein JNJ54_23130 [Myxococcaceae bacterium]|nr:hypothetical protein [Myxococcaceae bacterium]